MEPHIHQVVAAHIVGEDLAFDRSQQQVNRGVVSGVELRGAARIDDFRHVLTAEIARELVGDDVAVIV